MEERQPRSEWLESEREKSLPSEECAIGATARESGLRRVKRISLLKFLK
jgi:hypothetical protein